MPGAAEGADVGLTRLLQNGDDVRIVRQRFDVGHPQDHPEAGGQRDLLLRRQDLVSEEDHLMVDQRAADLGDRGIVQRTGQVGAVDFGAERAGQRIKRQASISHTHAGHGNAIAAALESVSWPGRPAC